MSPNKVVACALAALAVLGSTSLANASTYSGCKSSIGLRFGVSPAPSEVDPLFTTSCRATYPTTNSQGRGLVEGAVVPPGANFARSIKFTYDVPTYGDNKAKGSVWNWAIFVNNSLRASGTNTEVDSTPLPLIPGGPTGQVLSTNVVLEPTAPASDISVHWARSGHLYTRNWGPGSTYCGQAGNDGLKALPC